MCRAVATRPARRVARYPAGTRCTVPFIFYRRPCSISHKLSHGHSQCQRYSNLQPHGLADVLRCDALLLSVHPTGGSAAATGAGFLASPSSGGSSVPFPYPL